MSQIASIGEEMLGKNKRIYFDSIPELSALPKIEKKIKTAPAPIPEDLEGKIEGAETFDLLIPSEIKNMVENYKTEVLN